MSEINGILDNSTHHVVVLSDDKITLRGNVKIHGVLDVGLIKTTEIIADSRFEKKFATSKDEILNSVYKQATPNRYLAKFTEFLVENRGHYMIENIIEDGLNDFFYAHINKMNEAWLHPIHFVGSVAFGFKDIIKQLALSYEIELGSIVKSPMQGLIAYHQKNK